MSQNQILMGVLVFFSTVPAARELVAAPLALVEMAGTYEGVLAMPAAGAGKPSGQRREKRKERQTSSVGKRSMN
jgi:hypothetical protein